MTTVVVVALGSALGLIGMVVALRPPSPTLRTALADLERSPRTSTADGGAGRRATGLRIDKVLSGRLTVVASDQEFIRSKLGPLLAMAGTSMQELCGEVVLGATVGAVLPGLFWLVVTTGGVHLPFVVPLWLGLMLGCMGGALPVLVLQAQAKQARRSARRIVGSFLNLVVLCLAGGMGIEGALHASARIGEDGVSDRILKALVLAQDSGGPPWDALNRLGRELGVTELTELAAAVGLAGAEGARIRQTLTAKASSIRRHDLAEAEAEANTVTEKLFLPGVFLLLGFLVFIAYPAVARISAGF
jgi:tight adherence protein C